MLILLALSIANGSAALAQQAPGINQAVSEIAALKPQLESLYRDLHEHPDLAFHEQRAAATLADRLRALGFEVNTQVDGTGLD
jgi:hippurate hydrolase